MKKHRGFIVLSILVLLSVALYYYIALPAINIHSIGFWVFLLGIIVLGLILRLVHLNSRVVQVVKTDKPFKFGSILLILLVILFLGGSLLSSPIINAKKYQQLLKPVDREFTEDIPEISYKEIPLLDRASATILGNRKLGSMLDMVSQFEDSDLYSQINYQGTPVRVTPLVYASPIKWLTNHKQGIPAYIKIDMATQATECIKLKEGMKYSPAEYFNHNLYRHLRFRYPTYIFDDISFELDEKGNPFWTCSVRDFKVGLFGGQTIGRVVLCNAVTGETTDYAVADVPVWVDRVYSADLLISLYNYHGTLKHGFLNSILGQKDCLKTTDGYNFITMEDDVWVYTGITSVNGDQSTVGFVLINQRTMETRFYDITGAEELSAMSSAEGQVQHLGYVATFPLLLNISDEPTYVIALKDSAGLVKQYAMVNVQKYQIVATGDSISECEKNYIELLASSGITKPKVTDTLSVEGSVKRIAQSVVDGNSHYYILLEGDNKIYEASVKDVIEVIMLEIGDEVVIEYSNDNNANKVSSIKKK